MKLNLIYTLLIAGILTLGCKSGNQNNSADTSTMDTTAMEAMPEDESMGGMMNAMHQTMTMMDSMKLSGDPDYDFASMMQLHHKGGLAMINDEIDNGSDTTVIALAKQIKDGQQRDLDELQKYTANNTPSQSNSDFIEDVKSSMQKAKDDMDKNMRMSGNFDKDFVSLMTMHHKHGLDMAKAEVKYGKNPEMKKLAQKLVDQQEKERKQLADLK